MVFGRRSLSGLLLFVPGLMSVFINGGNDGLGRVGGDHAGDRVAAILDHLGRVDSPECQSALITSNVVFVRRTKVPQVIVGVSHEEGLVITKISCIIADVPSEFDKGLTGNGGEDGVLVVDE